MNALDFKRFNKGLYTGPELTGVAVVIKSVYREYRPAIFIMHNMADKRTLKSPVIAVFHLLINDALSTKFFCQLIGSFTTLQYLLVRDIAGALGDFHIMAAEPKQ